MRKLITKSQYLTVRLVEETAYTPTACLSLKTIPEGGKNCAEIELQFITNIEAGIAT